MSSSVVTLTDDQQRELGAILWSYRSSLDRVEFLLEAQLMFAASGQNERLSTIADLLEEAARAVGELDLRREVLLHGGPVDISLEMSPTLTVLAETADEPWATMFRDHQRWFDKTIRRLQFLVDESKHTMSTTLDLINQLVSSESASGVDGYDRSGRSVRSSAPSILFDSRA